MYSISIVLVASLRLFIRITDVNNSEGNMLLWHIENSSEVLPHSLLRICAAPDCAKSEVSRTEEDILYRSRAILYPIVGQGLW